MLHTVRPIKNSRYKVYKQNSREYTLFSSENFGDVIQLEVGALLVGKINNNKKLRGNKGEEKGFFEYGGSTIVLFFLDNQVIIDNDIIENSKKNIETMVEIGEIIGKKAIENM